MTVVFAHGLEGSPEGAKVQALRKAGIDVIAPDFRKQVLADRVLKMRAELTAMAADKRSIVLAGSSYGGLCVAALAEEFRETLKGLLLLAPALGHQEPGPDETQIVGADLAPPTGVQTIVIHGRQDEICDPGASKTYVERSELAHLELVEDGHRLIGSLDLVCTAAASLLHKDGPDFLRP